MNLLRRAYVLLAVLFCLVSQVALHATGLSPRAFKNVNQCFKPGYEYYSPIFGSAALACGIIENLRFYNVEAAYDLDGKRQYIKDKASADSKNPDPIMEIIKILFPSPAGQLTTETTADSSFGKFCTKPEQVAALLNFSYAVRNYYQNKKAAPLSQDISKILNTILQKDVIAAAFPKNDFEKTEKNKLLTNIAKAIAAEKAGGAAAFYPAYFVEQVITAFFCHKFADQQNIKNLLRALNDTIVDKGKIDYINGLLEKEGVSPALGNIDKSASLDDLWIIINRDIFTSVIPYKNGQTPISNASAKFYQRSTDTLSNDIFADCVETTWRHVVNFMLYDPTTDIPTFNMTSLDAHMNGKDATYIKNLKDFYAAQPPDKANAGDLVIRSAWNKVVADVGQGVVYRQKFDVTDAKLTNELDSGMLNLVRVFKTIFALDLDNEPTLVAGQEAVFKESAQKLVTDCLQKLCTVLRSGYSCEVDYKHVTIDSSRKDLLGNIAVQISDESEQLFSFTICVSNMHIDIQNLNILQKDSVPLHDEQIQKVRNTLMNGYEKTTRPSLFLLADVFSKNLSAVSCLYQLFNCPINDTASITKTLGNLQVLFQKNYIPQDRAILILKNILHSFSWNDQASVQQIMPTLRELAKINDFEKTLKKEVKGVAVATEGDLAFFSDLFYLYQDKNICSIKNLDLSLFSQLKEICLFYNSINSFKMMLPISIKMPSKVEFLESIYIWKSEVKELNLSGAVNLKDIYLLDNDDLENLILPESLEHLEVIHIQGARIEELNLSGALKLKWLNLTCENLKNIQWPLNKEYLENIEINSSQIKELDLSTGVNLKKISLTGNETLADVKLPAQMDHLEEINIEKSSIKQLNLVKSPTLKDMILIANDNLETINFRGSMPNLDRFEISDNTVKKITGFKFCPKLKKEDFPGITIFHDAVRGRWWSWLANNWRALMGANK